MALPDDRVPTYTPFLLLDHDYVKRFGQLIQGKDVDYIFIYTATMEQLRDYITRYLSSSTLQGKTAQKIIRMLRLPRGGTTFEERNNRILEYVGLRPRHRVGGSMSNHSPARVPKLRDYVNVFAPTAPPVDVPAHVPPAPPAPPAPSAPPAPPAPPALPAPAPFVNHQARVPILTVKPAPNATNSKPDDLLPSKDGGGGGGGASVEPTRKPRAQTKGDRMPIYTDFMRLVPVNLIRFQALMGMEVDYGFMWTMERRRDHIRQHLSSHALEGKTAQKIIRTFRLPRGGTTVEERNDRILEYVGLRPRHRVGGTGSTSIGRSFIAGVATGITLAGLAAAFTGQFSG